MQHNGLTFSLSYSQIIIGVVIGLGTIVGTSFTIGTMSTRVVFKSELQTAMEKFDSRQQKSETVFKEEIKEVDNKIDKFEDDLFLCRERISVVENLLHVD